MSGIKDLHGGRKPLGGRGHGRPVVVLETGTPEDVEALVKQAQSSLDEAVRLANASAKKLGIIEASEDERFLAENSRKQAEDLRVAAENMRKAAEIIRIENEQLRQGSETARGNAEQTRNTAEAARVLAEESRAASAAAQAVAEQTRVLDENSRKSAEQTRQSNEASRVSAESARASAEEARAAAAVATASAEALRVAAENARVAAETLRAAAESTRQSTFETNEAARASAYTAAETNRDSAYTAAENARDAAFAAKEATRDAANEAALNCAETLSALGPKCDEAYNKTIGAIEHNKNYADAAVVVDGLYIEGSSGKIRSEVGCKSIKFPCKASTTYTISKVLTSRFRLMCLSEEPRSGLSGDVTAGNGSTATITTNADSVCIFAFVYNSTGETVTFEDVLNSLQIEEGETATTYEAPAWIAKDSIARTRIEEIASSVDSNEKAYATMKSLGLSSANMFGNDYYKKIWVYTNGYITARTAFGSLCLPIPYGVTSVKVKASSNGTYIAFFDTTPVAGQDILVLERYTIFASTTTTHNVPNTAKFIVIGINNEGTDVTPVFLELVGYTTLYNIGAGVDVESITNEMRDDVFEEIKYKEIVLDESAVVSGSYIEYSTSTPTIKSDGRYRLSAPIQVSKGDYIKFTCTINAPLNVSVITKTDAEGTPIASIQKGLSADNSVYEYFVEEDGYIVLCWNNNYNKAFYGISFEAMQLLYGQISKKQASVSLKTINGVSLIGSGDVTIAQGPQGIQGIPGPAGAQGNSGYQGTAGELEVVNNLTDGGSASALSAEMGKKLGDVSTINNIPISPAHRFGINYGDSEISPSKFTSPTAGAIDSDVVDHFDLVTGQFRKAVKLNLYSGNTQCTIYRQFLSPIDASELFVNFGFHIDDDDVSKYTRVTLFMKSGNFSDSNNSCSYQIMAYNDAEHSRTGAFYNCLQLYSIGTKGQSFDVTQVTSIGLIFTFVNTETNRNAFITDLNFVQKMKKPGVCIIVDNFAGGVPQMAEYAASKGVKLNLSIIPNWIETRSEMPNLETIRTAQRLGHFIWNHTWNHVTTSQTELQVSEELFKADQWLIEKGFTRGAKVYSNPSAYYDNARYRAQFGSNALAIYHHWTTYPWQEKKSVEDEGYLIFNPVFPSTRMMLNISGLDWNDPTDRKVEYFANLAQAAIKKGGLAIIGFHGTFWTGNTDAEHLAGDRWKAFIDAVAAQEGQYFYTIDELLEGRFC